MFYLILLLIELFACGIILIEVLKIVFTGGERHDKIKNRFEVDFKTVCGLT